MKGRQLEQNKELSPLPPPHKKHTHIHTTTTTKNKTTLLNENLLLMCTIDRANRLPIDTQDRTTSVYTAVNGKERSPQSCRFVFNREQTL